MPPQIVIWPGYWTPQEVKCLPDALFVFGDNIIRTGRGGQACIRHCKNSIGIATKKAPTRDRDAYFTDRHQEKWKRKIELDIQHLLHAIKHGEKKYKYLVFSQAHLGTGLAKLHLKAPKLYAWLQQRLREELGELYTPESRKLGRELKHKVYYLVRTQPNQSANTLFGPRK